MTETVIATSQIAKLMDAGEIRDRLSDSHRQFIDLINSLSKEDFIFNQPGKWSAGQQLDHIIRATSPVKMAFGLPKPLLRILIGKSNRPSKTFDLLVEKYKSKLADGGKARGRFIPSWVSPSRKHILIKRLQNIIVILNKRVGQFSEPELDKYILPHPLLGKLTLREMLYFTIYHADHHRRLILAGLGQK